jgi:hypothetical protein
VASAAAEVTATVVGKVARTIAGSFSSKNPNKKSTFRKIGGVSIVVGAWAGMAQTQQRRML